MSRNWPCISRTQIKAGNWLFNVGIRGDLYNGLAIARQAEPRVGIAYSLKPTNTVLRVSYARTLETPFNENLVLSSSGLRQRGAFSAACSARRSVRDAATGFPQRIPCRLAAGLRQELRLQRRLHLEIHAQRFRLQRAGQHADHLSHRLAQLEDPRLRAARGCAQLSQLLRRSWSCRRWPLASSRRRSPEPARPSGRPGYPFRIDHDERFNETTHVQYQTARSAAGKPWIGFNWRYDSGLVAGSRPATTRSRTIPTVRAPTPRPRSTGNRRSISAG